MLNVSHIQGRFAEHAGSLWLIFMLHLALTCDFSRCSTCKQKTAVPVSGWSEAGLTNSRTDPRHGVPNPWDTALLWEYLHTTIPVDVNNFATRLHRGKKVRETRVKHSILLVIEGCYLPSFPQLWGGVKSGVNPKRLLPFPDLLGKKKKNSICYLRIPKENKKVLPTK